jgi:hypothetical protein
MIRAVVDEDIVIAVALLPASHNRRFHDHFFASSDYQSHNTQHGIKTSSVNILRDSQSSKK